MPYSVEGFVDVEREEEQVVVRVPGAVGGLDDA